MNITPEQLKEMAMQSCEVSVKKEQGECEPVVNIEGNYSGIHTALQLLIESAAESLEITAGEVVSNLTMGIRHSPMLDEPNRIGAQ